MAEFLVTCSLAVYLIALLYGAYRVIASRGTGRSVIREHDRKFRLIPGRASEAAEKPWVALLRIAASKRFSQAEQTAAARNTIVA